MAQKIQVVVERTYTYTPALRDLEYTIIGVTTIEQALEYDKKEYEAGEISLEEITITDPVEVTAWSIIDE